MPNETSRPSKPQLSPKQAQRAIKKAVTQALIMHKSLGNPVATYRDGAVVLVPPEDIPVPRPRRR